MSERVETVILIEHPSGRIHEVLRINGGEPKPHPACEVSGEREYLNDLPMRFRDADLCQRCFGKVKGR